MDTMLLQKTCSAENTVLSITSSAEHPLTNLKKSQRNPVLASGIVYLFADQFVDKHLLGG